MRLRTIGTGALLMLLSGTVLAQASTLPALPGRHGGGGAGRREPAARGTTCWPRATGWWASAAATAGWCGCTPTIWARRG